MTRLLAILGALLVLGFFLALRAPVPFVEDGQTVPVPADELLRLTQE